METIQPIIEPFDRLLGVQHVPSGAALRPMAFTVQQPIDDGLLLHNTLTKATVVLTAEEAACWQDNPASLPLLVEQWFAVPREHDDRLLARQVRAVARAMQNPCEAVTRYTIFTTTDCNARCFYCYEKGRERIDMSQATALRVAQFIARQCGNNEVELAWFGGEPLCNKDVITTICRRLKELGVKYYSLMTSNGYLMDADTVRQAKEEWLLRGVQITLDGTEQVYNRAKAYVYPGVNAYQLVISNIHRLTEAGINVKIRMNVDRYNADNLLLLADELNREFPDKRHLAAYSHPLFGSCLKQAAIYHNAYRKEVYERRRLLQERLKKYGLAHPEGLSFKLKLSQCMADSDDCLTILPTGHLGKCEHYSDSDFIGHIDSPKRDEAMRQSFKQSFEEYTYCADCPQYPECFRLEKCEPAHLCYPETKDEIIATIRESMLKTYRRYLKKKKKDETEH